MSRKWRVLLLLALAELLAMGLWFSATAVTPALSREWQLDSGQVAWLTMAVQVGFVVGALLSALFNVSDLWEPRRVLAIGAFAGGPLSGELVTSPPRDWSFTEGVEEIQLQISAPSPYSITTHFFVHEGELIRLHPTDLEANARSPRARRQKQQDDNVTHPPRKSAADLAYDRDLGPVVNPDGGFPETEAEEPKKEGH